MTARTILAILVGLVLGMLLAWGFAVTESAGAQSDRMDVAIAPGPGGMWVVTGGELRVCTSGPLRAGYELFVPTCGDPVRLMR